MDYGENNKVVEKQIQRDINGKMDFEITNEKERGVDSRMNKSNMENYKKEPSNDYSNIRDQGGCPDLTNDSQPLSPAMMSM